MHATCVNAIAYSYNDHVHVVIANHLDHAPIARRRFDIDSLNFVSTLTLPNAEETRI